MKAIVTAKGYTGVILVLNMKRFIHPEDRERFERLRGTRELARALRHVWPEQALADGRFITVAQEKQHREIHDEMTTEEIGYATGIFRAPMLEEFTFPTYALEKEGFEFPQHLMGNYQFKNLFIPVWKGWRIFIRPSYTGLFVIRLTRSYEKATLLEDITRDVIRLQDSLDVQSARKRLAEVRSRTDKSPEEIKASEESVLKFLEWLGTDEKTSSRLLYAPIQWKLAMEVCKIFVASVGYSIPVETGPVRLITPEPRLSTPLHDSYITYHLDEIWANRRFVPKAPARVNPEEEEDQEVTIPVRLKPEEMKRIRPRHIRDSKDLQQQLVSLLEGTLLRRKTRAANHGSLENGDADALDDDSMKYVPRFEPAHAHAVIETDMATWQDELCVLFPRATLIIPSFQSRHDELLIATLPGSTSRFVYARYWGAVERMIEFVIEVQVFARLLERGSFSLLEELAQIMGEIRGYLFAGDIRLHKRLPTLIADAAHLRRLTALCQSFGDPRFWGRSEYATTKAQQLMSQLGLPGLLDQIERNIASINTVVDHVDEWYMADLAEQSNDMATLLSLGLAAASFILTLLILPSFWADLEVIKNQLIKIPINILGTLLAIALIAGGAALSIPSIKNRKQIGRIMKRSLIRLRNTLNKAEYNLVDDAAAVRSQSGKTKK